MGTTKIFHFQSFQIEYLEIGSGDNIILAFHGFGRQPEDFNIFLPLMSPQQRIISISLFQHGQSVFPPERIPSQPLQEQEFSALITAFIAALGAKKVGLIGYSLGGKICLCLLEHIPEKLHFVMLFAPDGLKINPVYKFSSKTMLGRSLYKAVLHYPSPFFGFTKFAQHIGIIHPHVHRFVQHHMDTFPKRKLVYDTWLIYRDFEPNQQKIRNAADRFSIKLLLFFGKYDKIILPQHGLDFCRNWRKEAVHVLENGHLLLNGSTVQYLRNHSLWPDVD